MIELSIDTDTLREISDLLSGIQEKAVDWSEAGEGVGDLVRDEFNLRFQSSPSTQTGGMVQGDVYWRALNDGYLAANPRRRGGQVLIDSGKTWKSFANADAAGNINEFDADEMTFGSSLDHVPRLQEIWPIAFWSPELLEAIAAYLVEWYTKPNE